VPTLAPASINGRDVTLSWTPPSGGGALSGYTLIARDPVTLQVIAVLPVNGTTVTVSAPVGIYLVTIVATNASGMSAESNQITVEVP
jgi:hypothetical protein